MGRSLWIWRLFTCFAEGTCVESLADIQVAFLVYVNRSGSTFLASRLAEVKGVVVTIESKAVGELLRPNAAISDPVALRESLDQLYAELKFSQWGIPRECLEEKLAEATFPLKRESLFLAVLRALPGGESARSFVVKATAILPLLPELMQRYPALKALHVVRDPRAVYASQRRSVSSRTGRPMVQDPITMARRWRREVGAVAALPADRRLELRYETMLEDETAAVDRACEFLGVERSDEGEVMGERYADRIPETQRHLHTRVGDSGDTSRIEGWRLELSVGEIALLQLACSRAMKLYGYSSEPSGSPLSVLMSLPQVSMGFVRDVAARAYDRMFGLSSRS